MEQKREVQIKILGEKKNNNRKASSDEFLSILRLVSPGTNLRTALEGMVKASKGALIVVDNIDLSNILDGGFKINSRTTPQRLVELSKMDGSIILSKDMKRITHANVTLTPDAKIRSNETGTRHKAAERTARMIDTLTIAVSEKKGDITIYYKDLKYQLRETSEVLRRVSETLQILEKQRELFDENITLLNLMEIANDLHLNQACKVIQKGKTMQKILKGQEKTLIELGKEGGAIKLRIKELMRGVEKETDLVVKDYTNINLKKSKNIFSALTYEELIDSNNILTALAQKDASEIKNIKGWRLLEKTSLEDKDIADLIKEQRNLSTILKSEKATYAKIIGEEKAKTLERDLEKIQNQ